MTIWKKVSKKIFTLYLTGVPNLKKFNTLIIDGEGIEEHYLNNINKLPNIKYLIFEFHNDIFINLEKIELFKKLKKNKFVLKDKFINSYYFEKI